MKDLGGLPSPPTNIHTRQAFNCGVEGEWLLPVVLDLKRQSGIRRMSCLVGGWQVASPWLSCCHTASWLPPLPTGRLVTRALSLVAGLWQTLDSHVSTGRELPPWALTCLEGCAEEVSLATRPQGKWLKHGRESRG